MAAALMLAVLGFVPGFLSAIGLYGMTAKATLLPLGMAADRAVVVFGLIPRGLPGLVFASTALASGVITAAQFSALVLMVSGTTVLGLLLLGRRLSNLQAG